MSNCIAYDEEKRLFRLDTLDTSYWFRISDYGHLEHIHYGIRLAEQPIEALLFKRTAEVGSNVCYKEEDKLYCLDAVPLEWSGIGCGDFRYSPIEAVMPDGTFTSDFVYQSHRVIEGGVEMETLPQAYGEDETLEVTLTDETNQVKLRLYYAVFYNENVIARRAVIVNHSEKPLQLRRFLSMSVDLPDIGYTLHTFDGAWIREAHRHSRPVEYGMYVNASQTGNSSNRHNPGFILAEDSTGEMQGACIGVNLVYSGNHFGFVEKTALDVLRVGIGINPHCFLWTLGKDEAFESPQAVLSYSNRGFNGLSHNMHDFVNGRIVRGNWQERSRPVLLNDWEACFFEFNQRKLMRLARQAKKLGVELFVLDDGWFGKRDTDTAGLGDYTVNRKKLPGGLEGLGAKIKKLGMQFGLWFEPEMVNPDSDLYRAHPDWAVTTPGRTPTLGRNQLLLDLCNPKVRDYIVEQVGAVLDSAPISYVKWDMNRHISDACSPALFEQGRFYHSYIMGLYEVLGRIFRPRPDILLESCSSGGNRFDLGMLCYSPQVWASDDTDPMERLKIQEGLSYLYPQSCMGAHVSQAPHQQTLRDTPLSTRFNVAAFGCLGYELDLGELSPTEKEEVAAQIAYYKAHRRTFQYGRFTRVPQRKENKVQWQVRALDGHEAVTGFFQTRCTAAEGCDVLKTFGMEPGKRYRIQTRPQPLFVKRFGGLVKHIAPVKLKPDGLILRTINKHYTLTDCVEDYTCYGDALFAGVKLNNQFMGSNYNEHTRLLSDNGSNLYLITKQEDA